MGIMGSITGAGFEALAHMAGKHVYIYSQKEYIYIHEYI